MGLSEKEAVDAVVERRVARLRITQGLLAEMLGLPDNVAIVQIQNKDYRSPGNYEFILTSPEFDAVPAGNAYPVASILATRIQAELVVGEKSLPVVTRLA